MAKKNNPGCASGGNCCGACTINCGKKLYFGVTGVTANSACSTSTGGSAIIATGDAVDPAFFNSNTWYWDPEWSTGVTPGLDDLADGYTIIQCEQMSWFYFHNGDWLGQASEISALAQAVIFNFGGQLNVQLRFQTMAQRISSPFTQYISNVIDIWRFPGLCPTGTPTLNSRSINNAYCLDFNPSTTFMTWV